MNYNNEKYEKIIGIICEYKGISKEELVKILKDKEYRYILLLLLRKFGCDNKKEINNCFSEKEFKNIKKSYRKAEEKLYVNKLFRDKYFEMQKKIERII